MSQPDPEISRLIDQAARIKERDRRNAEREATKNAPKVFPPMDMESLGAYRALYPHPPTVIWMFGLLISIGGLIGSLMQSLFTNDKLVFGGLTILFILYGFAKGTVMPLIWYVIHHGWRNRLPFTLNGWDAFGSTHLRDSWQWHDLSITFESPATGTDFQAALNAAITVLIKNIINVTYKELAGEPTRPEWKWDPKTHTLTGTVNSQVLGLLTECYRGSLTHILNRFSATMVVTMNPTGNWYRVEAKRMGQTVG